MTEQSVFVGSYPLTEIQKRYWVEKKEDVLAFYESPESEPVYLDPSNPTKLLSILRLLRELPDAEVRVETMQGELNQNGKNTAPHVAVEKIDGFGKEWDRKPAGDVEDVRLWVFNENRYKTARVEYDPTETQWGSINVWVKDRV